MVGKNIPLKVQVVYFSLSDCHKNGKIYQQTDSVIQSAAKRRSGGEGVHFLQVIAANTVFSCFQLN